MQHRRLVAILLALGFVALAPGCDDGGEVLSAIGEEEVIDAGH